MLIETPYKEGDTITVKFISGEEVIARLDEEKGDIISLNKPLVVAATPQGLGLAPFMFTVNPSSKVNISTTKVLCIVKTDDEFAKQYISNTTGIAV
jgi:hypothetical protein